MIPDLLPEMIENRGERAFYDKARQLPDHYTVFYSYKFSIDVEKKDPYGLREADFVIVHRQLGFVVVEVKQGHVYYHNGIWQEEKEGRYYPLAKNPVEQARTAMFAILDRYKQVSKQKEFPLAFRYAVCFPDATHKTGVYPEDLHEHSCWTAADLDNLEASILRLFSSVDTRPPHEVTRQLITRVLSPSFSVFSSVGDQLERFNHQAEIVLTEEQERILEETEEDHRKIFFGAAGTGKTFIAMKKALDLAEQGKRVFLTCYNKHLVRLLTRCQHELITATNFHDYLLKVLVEHDYPVQVPGLPEEASRFYEELLPEMVLDLFATKTEEEKFDAIIVDEGQDFKTHWFICLDEMVKKDGHFYIFADRHQNLFGHGLDTLKDFQMSKHKLTINLRNTQRINEWAAPFLGGTRLRYRLHGGPEVEFFSWKTPDEERRLVEKVVQQLVSQGIKPHKMTILSPRRQENSSLSDMEKVGSWPLIDLRQGEGHGITFSTIRAYKGLEADVVLLIGIRPDSPVCTPADIYVVGTRARFMLKIFHQKDWSYQRFVKQLGRAGAR
ncbi:nuclease-related domain-containing DEAD/DEAH box helicase [Caldalkalibacillus thermarum]|uniref:nuclease-related domain-containing DEAD/DEAH box helicase n=1 Tax=Caldalkalibacillus thermarum TaxID=296745 RepID=UPI001E317F4A|nr:NERD domain-containing protein [Caldalkalibacillus thermarum]